MLSRGEVLRVGSLSLRRGPGRGDEVHLCGQRSFAFNIEHRHAELWLVQLRNALQIIKRTVYYKSSCSEVSLSARYAFF